MITKLPMSPVFHGAFQRVEPTFVGYARPRVITLAWIGADDNSTGVSGLGVSP